jgi:MYND finger/NACHT domain
LGFIKRDTSSESLKFVEDYRTIEEVGELIRHHGIRRVVLNACRSTHPSGSGVTIPRALRQYGVVEVVAMSYQVSSRGVQHFTSFFYCALFTTLSMPFAAWTARRLMQSQSDRLSRFGTKLSIMDYIVLIIYRAENVPQHLEIGNFLGKVAQFFSKQLPSLVADVPEKIMPDSGRERELLRLESMILEGDRAVLLVGQPGIGKSFLLKQLVSWWTTTKCITGTHTTQLSRYNNFSFEKLSRTLHKRLNCPGPYAGLKALVSFLRETKCLLIIDSLESMRVSESTTLAKQRGELMKFLRALHGGRSLVVLASRIEYKFLASYTSTLELAGLGMTAGIYLMRGILEVQRRTLANESFRKDALQSDFSQFISTPGLSRFVEILDGANCDWKSSLASDSEWQVILPTWDTEEDGIYLEEIYKLVDGHPLALKMLIMNLIVLGPTCNPKDFLNHLLQGGPLILDGQYFAQIFQFEDPEGLRTIEEVKSLISDVRIKVPGTFKLFVDFLASFWKVFPVRSLNLFRNFQMKEWNMEAPSILSTYSDQLEALQAAGHGDEFSDIRALIEKLKRDKVRAPGSFSEMEAEIEIMGHLLNHPSADIPPWAKNLPQFFSSALPFLHGYARDHGGVDEAKKMLDYFGSHESVLAFGYSRDALLSRISEADTASRNNIPPDSWEEVAMAVTAQGGETSDMADMLRQITKGLMEDGIKLLMHSHLIHIPDFEAGDIPAGDDQYILASPILTIIIRGMNWWDDNDGHAKSHHISLALTYARRCANWPGRFPTRDSDAWKLAKRQADAEFYNLAAAVAIAREYLIDKGRSLIIEQAMLDLVSKLDWGLATDGARVHIVKMLWEGWQQDAKEAASQLERSDKRPPRNSRVDSILAEGLRGVSLSRQSEMLRPIGRIFSAMTKKNATPSSTNDLTEEQYTTEIRLFDRRRTILTLSSLLLRFNNGPDDERTQQLCNDVKSVAKLLKKDTCPVPAIRDCLPLLYPLLDFSVTYTELLDGKRHFGRRGRLPIEMMRLLREDLIPAMIPALNISEEDLWAGIFESDFLEREAVKTFDNAIADIARKLSDKKFDEARKMIDGLREHEIQHALNDSGRHSKLLMLGCFASGMQRRFSDALQYLDEYSAVQKEIGSNGMGLGMNGSYTKYLRRALVLNSRYDEMLDQDNLEPCASCYAHKGIRRCVGCLQLVYCSRDCQVKDWKEHKKICRSLYSRLSHVI